MAADDLAAERAYVASLYARLDELRERASRRLATVLASPAEGTHQWRSERDALAGAFEERAAALSVGDLPLCFGRLDLVEGSRFHIGRLALSDERHEPLLVDWRAPAAQPFYQATPGDRQGVLRRRHLLTKGREVMGLDDEVFDLDALSDDERAGLHGDAALLASLDRARTGRMADIVATIQADQDRIIRSELGGVLVVEGGPGTGKTVVALHRAAYLLFTHRRRLTSHGVLIVGPNPVFLRYIEQVLPSLGETATLLLTPGQLFPGVVADHFDPPAVARVKGDLRMVDLLRRAIADRQRLPREDLRIEFEGFGLRLDRRTLAGARSTARASRMPHNRAREVVERVLAAALVDQLRPLWRQRYGGPLGDDEAADMAPTLRRGRGFRLGMEAVWPLLRPVELLNDLFGFKALIRSAARKLDESERALLFRTRQPDPDLVEWSVEDVALLDEAAELLGEPHRRRRGRAETARRRAVTVAEEVLRDLDLAMPVDPGQLADRFAGADHAEALAARARRDRTWRFGHVIVDEAQELSPMDWRAVFRRCPSRSMTIVGDLAQAGGPWRPDGWAEVLDRHAPRRWRSAELTVNYRTPREVMDVAAAVLAAADPDAVPPVAIRDAGVEPWIRRTEGPLSTEVADAVRAELAALGEGRLAVLIPPGLRHELSGAVVKATSGLFDESDVLDSPVAVLSVREAKGLEFDCVIIVEPALMTDESERGLADLYVALTRSTRRLGIIHSGSLPEPLTVLAPAPWGVPTP
jgi:DNA helicase IV